MNNIRNKSYHFVCMDSVSHPSRDPSLSLCHRRRLRLRSHFYVELFSSSIENSIFTAKLVDSNVFMMFVCDYFLMTLFSIFPLVLSTQFVALEKKMLKLCRMCWFLCNTIFVLYILSVWKGAAVHKRMFAFGPWELYFPSGCWTPRAGILFTNVNWLQSS